MKRIISFGDSIAWGNGSKNKSGYIPLLESKLKDVKVINRGMCADSTDWALSRIKRVLEEEEPDIILITEGINDILLHKQHDIAENLREIVKICKQNNVEVHISTIMPILDRFTFMGRMILSFSNLLNKKKPARIKPNTYYHKKIKEVNMKIQKMAKEENVSCVDMYTVFSDKNLPEFFNDKIHPNDKGYQLMANKFYEVLHHE